MILVGFGLLVMGLALVMTLSRSGTTCFAIALGVSGVVALRHQAKRSKRALMGAYLVLVFAVALGWTGIDAVVSRFQQSDVSYAGRQAIWNDALHIYHDFPVFGSGINTFGSVLVPPARVASIMSARCIPHFSPSAPARRSEAGRSS